MAGKKRENESLSTPSSSKRIKSVDIEPEDNAAATVTTTTIAEDNAVVSANPSNTMADLPDNVLQKILELTVDSSSNSVEFLSASLVCKKWAMLISHSDVIVNKLKPKIILKYTENSSKFSVTRSYRQLKIRIDSDFGHDFKDKVLSINPVEILTTFASSPSLNHLRDLTLDYVPLTADIHGTLSSLEMLRNLSIVNCILKDSNKVQPVAMKNLKHLKVEGWESNVLSLLNCKELETLNIRVKWGNANHIVNFLKQLDVVHQEILVSDSGSFAFFASSRDLKASNEGLEYLNLIPDSEFMMKFLHDHINSLTLNNENPDIKNIDALPRLNSVEKLDLGGRIGNEIFKKLIEKLPNIKEVMMQHCFDFNNVKLMDMSLLMKNLTHLDISRRSLNLSIFGDDISSVKFTSIRSLAVTLQPKCDENGVPQGYDHESSEMLWNFCAANRTLKHLDIKSFGGPWHQLTRYGGKVIAEISLICIFKNVSARGTSVQLQFAHHSSL